MPDDPTLINQAAISLGSNIDPERSLPAAVGELSLAGDLLGVSQVWESPAVGFHEQANFLNAAILLATPLSAEDIKQTVLRPIEDNLGRVRDPKNINAPRTIDLDLSIFLTPMEAWVFDENILTRGFVAVPLAEVLPDFAHPQTGQTLAEIASDFKTANVDLKLRPDCRLGSCDSPLD